MGSITLCRAESLKGRIGFEGRILALVKRGYPLRDYTCGCLVSSGNVAESLD
jgi:hypothetical protein